MNAFYDFSFIRKEGVTAFGLVSEESSLFGPIASEHFHDHVGAYEEPYAGKTDVRFCSFGKSRGKRTKIFFLRATYEGP